jgi:acyl-[acyl-carrier-protein]-phospholipid O-acyltransferase/long-chain-fatty-acid--[acyl-carrier-protein] ligase
MKGRVVLSFQPALLVLMGLALADAIWASYGVKPTDTLLSPLEFLSSWPNSRVLFDLWLIAMLGGAYCVPLYTQLQRQVRDHQRARAFALNNVMNAFFMVISAILILLAYTLGLNWLEMAIWGIGLIVIMAIGFQLTYKNVDFL